MACTCNGYSTAMREEGPRITDLNCSDMGDRMQDLVLLENTCSTEHRDNNNMTTGPIMITSLRWAS